MAIRQVRRKPQTSLQSLYYLFWNQFNNYSSQNEKFCEEFKVHPFANVRSYQDYAVSQGSYHLNVGINFDKHECKIGAYFRDLNAWDIYFNNYRDTIDSKIGEQLTWEKNQTKGSATLIRHLEFDRKNNWDIVFEQLISDLLLMKRVFAQYYDKKQMRQYWLFSWNENAFRLHDYFKEHTLIDWNNKHNNKLNIGDLVFLYCSQPESTIRYVTEVVKIDVPVLESIDDSDYSLTPPKPRTYKYCTRLKLLKEVNSRLLDFHILELNGLNGSIRSPKRPNNQLLSYILSIIESDILDYEEIENPNELIEGAKKTIIVNQYGRNPEARRQCIEVHGCYCHVCGLNFAEMYGEIGDGFIHVHHVVPLSTIGEDYVVDPIKDLIPVCPNCHAMLHRHENGITLSVDDLRKRIK